MISSKRRSALRMSLSASVGALYAVISIIFIKNTLLTYISCAIISVLMSIIAFGYSKSIFSLIKQSALIWGCSALLGGMMTALLSIGSTQGTVSPNGADSKLKIVFAVAIIAVFIIVRLMTSAKSKKSVTVKAILKNRQVTFSALCDSGNLMRDPISGDAVIAVSDHIIQKLCGKDLTDAMLSLDLSLLSESGLRIRIIPHRTANGSDTLAGFAPDEVTVISEKRKHRVQCILIPKKCDKNYFAGYSATVPTTLVP